MKRAVRLVDKARNIEVVVLGNEIARGGAGAVFPIKGDPSRVVKIYHAQTLQSDGLTYQNRIAAMLRQSPTLPAVQERGRHYVQIAWPLALAMENSSSQGFLGFAMPALDVAGTVEIEWVLNDKQAAKKGLRSDLGARVTLARQMAGVLSALHDAKHYVVDLKPINARFYKDALYMAFLDCDGFSIADGTNRIPAPQFTTEYLAPEFQSRGNPNDDPEQQDRFALAVVIFQLLNYGIHPYSGVPKRSNVPAERQKLIEGNFYAYGQSANSKIAPVPSSSHECIPSELRILFDRAFGLDTSSRPSAVEWRNVLSTYATRTTGQLRQCANDKDHFYFYGMPCSLCLRLRRTHTGHQTIKKAVPSPTLPPARPNLPTPPPTVRKTKHVVWGIILVWFVVAWLFKGYRALQNNGESAGKTAPQSQPSTYQAAQSAESYLGVIHGWGTSLEWADRGGKDNENSPRKNPEKPLGKGFEFKASTLSPGAMKQLDEVAVKAKSIDLEVIIAVGHTDRIEDEDEDDNLSERRAVAAQDYLVSKGIPVDRIYTEGLGNDHPVTKPGQCEGAKSVKVIECLRPDRRVDIELISTINPALK